MSTDYENARNDYIAHRTANIAWDYKHNVRKYEGQRDQAYLFTLMKGELEALLRTFDGYEKDFGL